MDDPAMKGAVAFLVSVDLEKTVLVNITAPARTRRSGHG